MKKKDLVIYRVVTGILSAHMMFTSIIYFVMHDMVKEVFESLGVSSSVIYPLAIAKILGIATLWLVKSPVLKQLAYLGFALDFMMAITTHLMAHDGGAIAPFIALVFVITSYIYYRKLYIQNRKLAA